MGSIDQNKALYRVCAYSSTNNNFNDNNNILYKIIQSVFNAYILYAMIIKDV